MNINDSVVSEDGTLKVTLVAFDPNRGKGQIKVEELSQDEGRFYINTKFALGESSAVDYRTGDVLRASPFFEFSTEVKNNMVASIELTRLQ